MYRVIAVPARGDVLGVGRLGVNATTGAIVGHLDLVVQQQNVFGFDVAVKDAVPVHVIDRLVEGPEGEEGEGEEGEGE